MTDQHDNTSEEAVTKPKAVGADPVLGARESIWTILKGFEATEEEAVVLRDIRSSAVATGALAGSVAALSSAVLLGRVRSLTRLTRVVSTVAFSMVGFYGGALSTAPAACQSILKLSDTSSLKREMSGIIYEWNPAYADYTAQKVLGVGVNAPDSRLAEE
jgi:hypothetical protein